MNEMFPRVPAVTHYGVFATDVLLGFAPGPTGLARKNGFCDESPVRGTISLLEKIRP
ncbi:MAG: hypothetical protein METHP_01096 [Methanoregula sp. SKADARSKE-2]|nr:MAG: hypothetical protein METHP_01096 [Methanoregula sp. SKADARSKE-2]